MKLHPRVYLVSAARTPIAPKGGLHKNRALHELAGPALDAAWISTDSHRHPDMVILGNALAAGGNPARLCSLASFDQRVPAITIDTQCCSGMDAIGLAAAMIRANKADTVLAGGVESFSQAPLRARQTAHGPEPYTQARFTPWAERDPNVLQAAQDFANRHGILRTDQEAYAIASHAKAIQAYRRKGMPGSADPFTRSLTSPVCARFPALIKGSGKCAITAATVAPEADGAAVLLVVGEAHEKRLSRAHVKNSAHLVTLGFSAIEVLAHEQVGCDPVEPALGGVMAGRRLLSELSAGERLKIRCVEIMESFAAQAIYTAQALGFPKDIVNQRGGMLAMGHPIGASGAVLVGNLFYRLQAEPTGTLGIAVIPATGGLGSALLLRKASF